MRFGSWLLDSQTIELLSLDGNWVVLRLLVPHRWKSSCNIDSIKNPRPGMPMRKRPHARLTVLLVFMQSLLLLVISHLLCSPESHFLNLLSNDNLSCLWLQTGSIDLALTIAMMRFQRLSPGRLVTECVPKLILLWLVELAT